LPPFKKNLVLVEPDKLPKLHTKVKQVTSQKVISIGNQEEWCIEKNFAKSSNPGNKEGWGQLICRRKKAMVSSKCLRFLRQKIPRRREKSR
jgi:hypothetical protein